MGVVTGGVFPLQMPAGDWPRPGEFQEAQTLEFVHVSPGHQQRGVSPQLQETMGHCVPPAWKGWSSLAAAGHERVKTKAGSRLAGSGIKHRAKKVLPG